MDSRYESVRNCRCIYFCVVCRIYNSLIGQFFFRSKTCDALEKNIENSNFGIEKNKTTAKNNNLKSGEVLLAY